MRFDALLISCEHASRHVPRAFAMPMRGARAALRSHRGSDLGAGALATTLARRLGAPAFLAPCTRLLVDTNRSLHHRALFSEWTRGLAAETRGQILADCYTPYRDAVESAIATRLRAGRRVLHISVHSFAARLHGVTRRADVGLLYDPSRRSERELCARWRAALAEQAPDLRVRRNYPYRGISDGFSVALRRRFPASRYACVELELNQALLRRERFPNRVAGAIAASLRGAWSVDS